MGEKEESIKRYMRDFGWSRKKAMKYWNYLGRVTHT
jgi:hypothetical protein